MLRRVITDAARRAAGTASTADSVANRWVSSALCASSGEGATSMMIRQPSSCATWARHMSRLNAKGTRPIGVQVAPTPYFGNMIVERLPWVAPLPEPWEAEYQQWSDERRQKFLKKLPESLVNPKADFEERDAGEVFDPAPRETEADKTGDQRTMHRKLDEFLFLVVQDAKSGEWGFPRREHADGETMREVARQAMEEAVGDSVETYLVGNAPLGHFYEAKAGAEGKEGGEGTNFYHRAQWLDGTLKLESTYKDYKWLTKVRARFPAFDFHEPRLCDSAVDGIGDDETQLSLHWSSFHRSLTNGAE
jgi:large subunit ribosomal protein L46